MRRSPGYGFAALGAVALLACAIFTTTAAAAPARPGPKILSASWGTDGAVGCPSGETGLDNIPVTFNRFIRRSSIQTTDFAVVRSDGSTATPTCALQFPPDESDEAQTVDLIGDFGDAVNGPTPVGIRIVGTLQGKRPERRAGTGSRPCRRPTSSRCREARTSWTRGRSRPRSTGMTATAAQSARPSCV